jgi:hypothetical protein
MRLVNTSSLLIEEFLQRMVPEYAILSHVWQDEEVTLKDVQSGSASAKKGYAKIVNCCKKSAEDGYQYCWIDTCCIDKTSSAELSEAINSMYQWYKDSSVCYVYLADFEARQFRRKFVSTRWFKRGWTLQELIAPTVVEFYDANWDFYGTRISLQDDLMEATGIEQSVLRSGDPTKSTVVVRMSWAARRETTRIEDTAYCLMGLFGVNMPLLYGEGLRAFRRLQEEIMRTIDDETLIAWSPSKPTDSTNNESRGLLALSPHDFDVVEVLDENYTSFHCRPKHFKRFADRPSYGMPQNESLPWHLTHRGLHLTPPIKVSVVDGEIYACICLLESSEKEGLVCVKLHRSRRSDCYVRREGEPLRILPKAAIANLSITTIYVDQPTPPSNVIMRHYYNIPSFEPIMLIIRARPDITMSICESLKTSLHGEELQRLRRLSVRTDLLDNVLSPLLPQNWTYWCRVFEDTEDLKLREMTMGDLGSCYFFSRPQLREHNLVFIISYTPEVTVYVRCNVAADHPSCEAAFRYHKAWYEATEERDDCIDDTTDHICPSISLPNMTHTFSISVRRVSSPPLKHHVSRFVLSVDHQMLPWPPRKRDLDDLWFPQRGKVDLPIPEVAQS